MILIPNVTLIKLIVVEQRHNPTIQPFTHKVNDIYRYVGKPAPKEGQTEQFRNQFIKVVRLRDKHEFTMFKDRFGDIKTKSAKKRTDD